MSGISNKQRDAVITETARRIQQAKDFFGKEFLKIPVIFDLRGKAAGMYRVRAGERQIRYNPYIFGRYFEDNLEQTVPHEVAHYVADMLHGFRNIRPHGPEWKAIMDVFGADARASCSYDLEGLPGRQYRRFQYRCRCRQHELTAIRHNKIRRRQVRYFCKQCGDRLVYTGGSDIA